MKMLCECGSFKCDKTIEASTEELQKAVLNGVLIANDCGTGPDDTDIFIEKKNNLYYL